MFSTPKESWEIKHSFVAHRVSRKLAWGIFHTTAGILKHHSSCMKEAGLPLVKLFYFHHQRRPWPQALKQTSNVILQGAGAVLVPFCKHAIGVTQCLVWHSITSCRGQTWWQIKATGWCQSTHHCPWNNCPHPIINVPLSCYLPQWNFQLVFLLLHSCQHTTKPPKFSVLYCIDTRKVTKYNLIYILAVSSLLQRLHSWAFLSRTLLISCLKFIKRRWRMMLPSSWWIISISRKTKVEYDHIF